MDINSIASGFTFALSKDGEFLMFHALHEGMSEKQVQDFIAMIKLITEKNKELAGAIMSYLKNMKAPHYETIIKSFKKIKNTPVPAISPLEVWGQ